MQQSNQIQIYWICIDSNLAKSVRKTVFYNLKSKKSSKLWIMYTHLHTHISFKVSKRISI